MVLLCAISLLNISNNFWFFSTKIYWRNRLCRWICLSR